MTNEQSPRPPRTSPKIWATLTLAGAIAASSAIAIAGAEGTRNARPDKAKHCALSVPCLQEQNTSSGAGLEGIGSSNAGVYGESASYYGLVGVSNGFYAGIGGFSDDTSAGASGVYGESENGYGVTGYATSGYAIYAEGNVLVDGEVYTSGNCHAGCSKTRREVSFGSRSSQPTIDDVGEATLRDGVARVALAADFANAIDTQKPYVVLLTPEGDAPLYVTNRTATSFEVRQMGGGRSSVPFAYRIVAKPFAVNDERLPFRTVKDFSAQARGGR